MELEGKVALVTGASRGIGREIALTFARAGADVACAATSAANAESTVKEIEELGRRAVALGGRVEDPAQVTALFEEAEARLAPLSILVNNAGLSRPKPILEMTGEDWDAHFGPNAKGPFLCSREAALRFKARGAGGTIINIGSIAGENAFPLRLGYCTSKAALHHMTRVMAIEWASLDIRVNAIAPGYIETDIVRTLAAEGLLDRDALEGRIPQRRLGNVNDIAQAAVYLASDAARYVTGSVLTVDGGWSAYGFV